MMPEITTIQQYGHYVIYVNSNFWASCDDWREVDDEVAEIERLYSDDAQEMLQ